MASSSGSTQAQAHPQSLPFSFPTDEETRKYMQDFGDLPCIQDMLKSVVVKPENLSIMTAKFQMITSVLAGFAEQDRVKLREKCDSDDSTIKKLVGEKADLEKRLSSVTEKFNREMDVFRGLNLKLNGEMEELRGLNLKLNGEMEELRGLNLKLNGEMEELRGLNSKLNREVEELRGRNSKVSNRLVELGGAIEVAREESEFLRSKNECLCSEVEQARVENKRLQGLVDGFGAREHAIKLEGVNEFASSPRFLMRANHIAKPYILLAGQMGVDQMAKIAGVPPVQFKWAPGLKLLDAGPYKIPKLGEVRLDNEHTLEAWDVTEVYDWKKRRVLEDGKRKANDAVERAASRPRTDDPSSFMNPVLLGVSLPII